MIPSNQADRPPTRSRLKGTADALGAPEPSSKPKSYSKHSKNKGPMTRKVKDKSKNRAKNRGPSHRHS